MPIAKGRDSKGNFMRWGSGKKYYYISGNKRSRNIALKKAVRQGMAAHASGWKR